MGSYERCEICKEWDFTGGVLKHKCKPLWMCGIGDEEDDYHYKVYAHSAESAAEKCASDQESNWDYSFIESGGVDISVFNPKTEEVTKFYVGAEHNIHYSASERKDE